MLAQLRLIGSSDMHGSTYQGLSRPVSVSGDKRLDDWHHPEELAVQAPLIICPCFWLRTATNGMHNKDPIGPM